MLIHSAFFYFILYYINLQIQEKIIIDYNIKLNIYYFTLNGKYNSLLVKFIINWKMSYEC